MNRFLIIITLGVLLSAASTAFAQTGRGLSGADMAALIDSLSNPMLAEGSGVMRFERLRIDAGEMNEDSRPSEHVFHWRNEGSEPLSVTFVQTTCGCASPSFDRGIVRPGEKGSLKITYHPKGHPGGFLRKIFVYTNLSDEKPTAILELSGKVQPSVLPTDDYPVAMGPLLLKRASVDFSADGRQTERIECLNAGKQELEITADRKALPAGVSIETLKIAPGGIADLVIRFDPSKAASETPVFGNLPESRTVKRPASAPVFLKGIPLPPTQCMITVNFK